MEWGTLGESTMYRWLVWGEKTVFQCFGCMWQGCLSQDQPKEYVKALPNTKKELRKLEKKKIKSWWTQSQTPWA